MKMKGIRLESGKINLLLKKNEMKKKTKWENVYTYFHTISDYLAAAAEETTAVIFASSFRSSSTYSFPLNSYVALPENNDLDSCVDWASK